MSSLQQSEHTLVVRRVVKEPPCPTEGNVCLFFSLSIHWISFHGFMSYILLSLYDTTLAWSALFSYRRVVELSVTTEDVLISCDGKMDSTGHIPLSTFQRNLIFFNLTQEVFWREFWRPGIQTPKSTFAVRHTNPPFVSWKSGVKDGEALKGRGFKPLHLYCKINLWILIFF